MSSFLKCLIAVCFFSGVAGMATEPPGFVEGHLKILQAKEVELADGNAPAITAENYAQYPLLILSQAGNKEIAQVTADGNGNFRTALPAGRLCLGCARTRTRSCSRETTTIHDCFEPHSARRYGYRHRCPLDWSSTPPFQGCRSMRREPLKTVCAFGRNCDPPNPLERNKIDGCCLRLPRYAH